MTNTRSLHLRVGELVEVRSEQEILATLDDSGALDGLPFMPEMLAFCGQRLRVEKRADKACDTINYSGSRRLYDTVLLAGGRCTGDAHGGCQTGCLLFWKEAWLRRVASGPRIRDRRSPGVDPAVGPPIQTRCDRARLVSATRKSTELNDGDPPYRCQATDLLLATSPMAWWDPRQYMRDVLSGNVGIMDVIHAMLFRLFLLLLRLRGYRLLMWSYSRLQSWRGGTPFPFKRGVLDKTPRSTLGLEPGELVRVKSQEEILKTVNTRNRNHGLSFDPEMVRYCGGVYRVRGRVERIIDERTGKMIALSNDCIVLDGVVCQAEYSHKRMFCPRSLYPFWREIWLERVTGVDAAAPRLAVASGCPASGCDGRAGDTAEASQSEGTSRLR